jgi:hypothetical protein
MFCINCNNKEAIKYSEYSTGNFCSSYCAKSFSTKQDQNKLKKAVCVLCNKDTYINKRASITTAKCEECKKIGISKVHKEYYRKSYPRTLCKKCEKVITRGSSGYCRTCYPVSNENYYKIYIKNWIETNGTNLKGRPRIFIKKYILDQQKGVCSECGLAPIWNNKPIVFILDHIDGNSNNNSPNNFRMVCPNCDSQLDTFKNKNRGNGRLVDREYRRELYHKNKEKYTDGQRGDS